LLESEKLLQLAHENAEKLLPADETFHLPSVRAELAQTEHALGNFAVAADLYRRALEARERGRSGNRQHANMLQRYARLLTDMGRAAEAERMLNRAFAEYQQASVPIGGTGAPVAMSAALSAMGRHAEALNVLDRFVDGRELLPVPSQIRLEIRRAEALLAVGDAAKAEPILERQMQRLSALPQRQRLPLLESEARLSLGRLLLARQRDGDAREMLEMSLRWRRENLSPHSPLLAESEVALAECLLTLGDAKRSRSLYLEAKSIHSFNEELGEQYRRPFQELGRRLAMNEARSGTG
jgi:tetratricopeptide (TPR) repeat protein